MIRKSIMTYYWFGTCMRYLQDCRNGTSLGSANEGRLRTNITSFFKILQQLELQVTLRASRSMKEFTDELLTKSDSHRLTEQESEALHTFVLDVRKTLDAEISGYRAYVVAPKRLDVKRLTDDVAGLFAPEVFDRLPEVARFDFSEAGKCIAFERPTAAAFHLMRGTEATLRAFQNSLIRRGHREQLWGPILDRLRKCRSARQYSTLLNHLDHIRQAFRNPTQHPEKIYDIHEAQDLFSLCIEVANRMAPALRD